VYSLNSKDPHWEEKDCYGGLRKFLLGFVVGVQILCVYICGLAVVLLHDMIGCDYSCGEPSTGCIWPGLSMITSMVVCEMRACKAGS